MQDTFIGIWKAPEKYDPSRGSLRTFLLTIAHRRAVDIIRSEQARTERETRPPDPDFFDLEDEVLTRRLSSDVQAALVDLTQEEKEADHPRLLWGAQLRAGRPPPRHARGHHQKPHSQWDEKARHFAGRGDFLMEHHEMIDLVPLYALDALEGSEIREFEAHLETCQRCRAELAAHQSVAAALIVDEPAPGPVWDHVAAAVSNSRQSPRVAEISARRAARDRPLKWIAAVAAVAALLLALLAVFQAVEMNRVTGPEGVLAAAEAAAGEPGAIVADLESPAGTVARVVLTSDGEGFLLPADLEPLSRGPHLPTLGDHPG